MNIKTKFNVGNDVYFLQFSEVLKDKIVKIVVEHTDNTMDKKPLVTYYFNGSHGEFYKYEQEIASTISELIRRYVPKGDTLNSDNGVTDDLVKLQSFVRDCASNWDCDRDAHKYKTICRVCEARKLLII